MFMPAHALRHDVPPGDAQEHPSVEAMWASKEHEVMAPGSAAYAHFAAADPDTYGHGPSMEESVRRSGVKDPVQIFHSDRYPPSTGDGHHRIAAANLVNPGMELPVQHERDPWDDPIEFGVIAEHK